MKSPEQIIEGLMAETPDQTETRRALAKAQRESYEDEPEYNNLSDRQRAHKDAGVCEGDYC